MTDLEPKTHALPEHSVVHQRGYLVDDCGRILSKTARLIVRSQPSR